MSDSDQDRKTEEPTSRRLERAREEGQVPRSRDLAAFAVVGGVVALIWMMSDYMGSRILEIGRLALSAPHALVDHGAFVSGIVQQLMALLFSICAPVALGAALVAILVNGMQTAGLFSVEAITPKIERLDPVQGFKNLFSRRSLVELVKSLIKMVLLAGAFYAVIITSLPTLVRIPHAAGASVGQIALGVFARFFVMGLLVFGLIAVFDFWYQRFEHLRQMRMTPEEVKREHREDEGDPHMRGRRQSLAFEALSLSLLERTAAASLIIHGQSRKVAVALIIDKQSAGPPWVVNKGTGHVAASIVAVARDKKIRILDDARLATRINDEVAVDGDLPKELAARVKAMEPSG